MTTNMETLTEQEKRVLKLILESQRKIATITVRELQEKLGYASPGSPHTLIVSLEKKGLIKRRSRGQIEVL